MRDKTTKLIEAAAAVLAQHNPMTLRQVYYQLVSKHVIDNNRGEYQRLSGALVKARKQGLIPWDWIEDRTRKPRQPNMWGGLAEFLHTVRHSYRRDIWASQSLYLEVWLEKEALSGIFEPITEKYGVTLVVGRGYDSWTALHGAPERIKGMDRPAAVLCFGDFDPSGEDIIRALAKGLEHFGVYPYVTKVALSKDDVLAYDLPPDFTKKTDSRSKLFIERFGDMAVELDALPIPVLQAKIWEAIEANLDLTKLAAVQEIEAEEVAQLRELMR